MPLRGKEVNLGDKLIEMKNRNQYMNSVFELTQQEHQAYSIQMLQDEEMQSNLNQSLWKSLDVGNPRQGKS